MRTAALSRRLGAAGAASLLLSLASPVTGLLGAADAATAVAAPSTVLPSTVELTSAKGQDSACSLMVRAWADRHTQQVTIHDGIACSTRWKQFSASVVFDQILPDGSRHRLPFGSGAGEGSPVGVTAQQFVFGWPACQPDGDWNPLPGTTYHVVVRSKATVRRTLDNSGRLYSGVAEKLVTFTC